jgi:DNA-binding NarL/FixJ family response regulator
VPAPADTLTLKLLIVDDHPVVRAGIRSSLAPTIGAAEIFEAGDGLDALEIAAQARPDIIFMDISMPGMNGIEATRRLSAALPECKVIIVSMHRDEERVTECLRAGAVGYLLKDMATSELTKAIEAVQRGEIYIGRGTPSVVNRVLRTSVATRPVDLLSNRQREILQLIAEGQSTKEIGYRLNLSSKTVETHRRLLMQRLEIYDVAGLARFAIRSGIVSAER